MSAQPKHRIHLYVLSLTCAACLRCRWEGKNGPRPTDYDAPRNFISAAPASLRRFALCTSAGVDRYKTFPFFILNTFGVLTFKKQTEDFLKASGIPFTIVRPGRCGFL